MRIEPDPVLWGALLWACRLHNNVILGEEIAHLASSGTCILLSNIYTGLLKTNCYTPRIKIVLHDLGEEQSLEVQSEKLAIAFGFISTRPGTTIKIVKNLRVCSDRRDVMQLISKITGRKTIMRLKPIPPI
ncbi:hypothetical protein L6164_019862 [Bauhinia variegata]|uniref:Uncharacterized protein n=1 Tax=Bauhinia variegata TaxID=167791 RepID=A0ACB9MUI3_BAUVA|nr:hypothetical protein L6164_019862 [Bauhinia variegata]